MAGRGVSRSGGLVCLLLLTACGGTSAATVRPAGAPAPAYHGAEPEPVRARPSFTLTDTSGRPYAFSARTHGRPTYLYFGYTHCPDACPTAMADVAAALRRQPASLRERTAVVFVSTDAARDTGPVVRRWLDQFSRSFVGLTGTQAQLDRAATAAGLAGGTKGGRIPTVKGHPAAHPETAGTAPHRHVGALGYSVDHPDVILAYDARDRLPVLYTGGSTPADIAADLPILAREKDRS